jgi:hypothetical protein
MKRFLLLPAIALPLALSGQTQETAPPPSPEPPPTAWSWKGFSFSGYVDTYLIKNYNNPESGSSQLQAFNFTSNRMSLNSATAQFAYDPKPIGFKLDLGIGRTYDSFFLSESRHNAWQDNLLNAYVTLKPVSWKGLQVDFGKFVTSAGAELTESHLNWNYSRSLLFTYGPFFHFGVRTSFPVTRNFTAGVQLVNGWNNSRDNNTGKTMGFTGVLTAGKVTWANTFYTGPENTATNKGFRNFYDTAMTVAVNDRSQFYVNFDWGQNKALTGDSTFYGLAGAARFALGKRFAIAPRLEFYRDADGFMTGVAQTMKDFTLTGEMKMNDSIISKLEYRRDWCDQPYFQHGPDPFMRSHQNLVMASFIFVLRPGWLDFGNGRIK